MRACVCVCVYVRALYSVMLLLVHTLTRKLVQSRRQQQHICLRVCACVCVCVRADSHSNLLTRSSSWLGERERKKASIFYSSSTVKTQAKRREKNSGRDLCVHGFSSDLSDVFFGVSVSIFTLAGTQSYRRRRRRRHFVKLVKSVS